MGRVHGERSRAKWSPEPQAPRSQPSSNNETIMSTLNYSWNVRGTLNGDFMSASGTTASIDGVADVHGTAGEGAPFNHSTWIWGGMAHYGLAWMRDGHKVNPCEKYPYHMTRHWYGGDGSHIWSSHTITGAEGAWAGDIACVAEHFVPKGPILGGYIRGQYPSHWVATKRSDREVDVHGIVTLMVKGGGTYTAHVHEYIKFWEPCVQINRHYWKLEYLEAEYYPTHWYHKEKAICDPNWNFGKTPADGYKSFSWHLFGTIGNKSIDADGFKKGSLMLWDGNKKEGNWIVKAWPQYALAVPKGNDHIWYRSTFQFELNNGSYYSGYWEMDIHFRRALEPGQMPNPYVVKFWPETWDSKPHYWHFYEREEVEQSTYDKVV